jgi:hypothetical protein
MSSLAQLEAYEAMLIVLGTVVLTLAGLWLRDSIVERRDARKYRQERDERRERKKGGS